MNRRLLAVVYSLSILLGLLTVLWPSESIQGVLGLHLTYTYGILLLVGAIGALIAILKPNYKLETIFLWVVMGGYGCYDIALWGLFAERVGVIDGLPPPYGPALAIAVLTLFIFGKILVLTKKNRELVKASDNARLG